jgi:cyclopropane-fatty-acyl-phospholipid synthase
LSQPDGGRASSQQFLRTPAWQDLPSVSEPATRSRFLRSGALQELQRRGPTPLVERVLQRAVLARLDGWTTGHLVVELPDGTTRRFGPVDAEACATLHIHSPAFFRKFALRGDLGAGESYMDGDWSADDLPRFLELVMLNQHALELESPLTQLLNVPNDLLHRLRRNTRAGSRRNIRAHYDLSNDFFALFLDETMTYSAAKFDRVDRPLAEAQREKYRALGRKIGLRAGQHVLEIGCGWGGFAEVAATEFGARVTGITVSQEQHDFARQRLSRAGISDRTAVMLRDYRDVVGRFDHVISIEMIEAVGREYWDSFFATCDRVLAPGGRVGLQVITMPDFRFEAYAKRCDWIQKYIFPGGLLPSLTELGRAAGRVSALTVTAVEDIGLDYARTLAEWRTLFMRRLTDVRALGFDDRFIRMWDYYLAVCEGAFATRTLGTMQIVMARAGERLT